MWRMLPRTPFGKFVRCTAALALLALLVLASHGRGGRADATTTRAATASQTPGTRGDASPPSITGEPPFGSYDIVNGAITIPATLETTALPGFLSRPMTNERAPGIVVLHGCEGYRKRYDRIAQWLASYGYVAVAIDTLTPAGVTNSCGHSEGSRREGKDARATLAWLRAQPFVDGSRLGVIGYSMGGIATLDVADPLVPKETPAGLKAAVAYYPSCRYRTAESIAVPLAILDGDADDWTPAGPCIALARAGTSVGKTVLIETYPGATHAFNVDAPPRTAYGHPLRYDPVAAADAANRTLDFFSCYLGGAPAQPGAPPACATAAPSSSP
jgi:dienelactone hydrolase